MRSQKKDDSQVTLVKEKYGRPESQGPDLSRWFQLLADLTLKRATIVGQYVGLFGGATAALISSVVLKAQVPLVLPAFFGYAMFLSVYVIASTLTSLGAFVSAREIECVKRIIELKLAFLDELHAKALLSDSEFDARRLIVLMWLDNVLRR